MIVRKMTANFGVLQNRTLELSPGLNILEAPNEYGKSTWCAFLRAMLYGVDSAQRSRGGRKPDKVLYAPWNGSPMSGTMELSHDGKDITLSRSTRSPSAPMRVFSAVYTGSGQPVSGLTGENAGETLTGAALPVFERTAFIGAAGLGVQQGAELERKITALVTAGEESGSFTEASARLRAMQRKCRFRNSGRLPELESEMKLVRGQLAALDDTAAELARVEEMTERARLRRAARQEDSTAQRQERRSAAAAELSRCRAELESAERETARQEQAVAAARETLRLGILEGGEPNDAAAERVRSDEHRARHAERAVRSRVPGPWLWVLCFLLAGVSAVGGYFNSGFWIGTVLFLVAAAVLGVASIFIRREKSASERLLAELLGRYGVSGAAGIGVAFAGYRRQWEETEKLEAAAEQNRERVRALSEKQLELHRRIAAMLTEDEAQTRQLWVSDQEEQLLREELSRLRGRLDTLGDPLVLKSRLGALEEEHRRAETELEALTVALDEMALADEEMQSEFSPALARSTAAILSRLTGGAYSELSLDRELNALVRCAGEPVLHESGFLSRGTVDQLYLALRLALCDMLLSGDEPCPIVLDDALINFDDTRMGYALDVLREIAQRRQILLFTCHSREKRYIEDHKE